MNEENTGAENQENQEWEAPPPPEKIEVEPKEEAQMSEVATLGNIFFEPGKTFEDLRRKPRFIMAFVIMAILTTVFVFAMQSKLGEERYRRFNVEQLEKQSASMSPEQKENAVDMQMTIQKYVVFGLPIFLVIFFLIGSLLYWLGAKLMGGSMGFLQAISVWVYSSFPVAIVSSVANFIVLFLKSPDDIDIASSARGLIQANPTLFFGGKDMPVLTTLVSTIDLLAIWGIVLAAIGLTKVAKLSKGSAWALVLIFTLLGITYRVLMAFISGLPQ